MLEKRTEWRRRKKKQKSQYSAAGKASEYSGKDMRVCTVMCISVIVSVPIKGQHNLSPAVSKCAWKLPVEPLKCGFFRSAPQSPQWLFLRDGPCISRGGKNTVNMPASSTVFLLGDIKGKMQVAFLPLNNYDLISNQVSQSLKLFDPGSRAKQPNPLLHWSSSQWSSFFFHLEQ